jgi:hypothetical protein
VLELSLTMQTGLGMAKWYSWPSRCGRIPSASRPFVPYPSGRQVVHRGAFEVTYLHRLETRRIMEPPCTRFRALGLIGG